MEFLIEDPDTNVIAMYLEGVRNGRKFIRMLKKAQAVHKPVVILKAGKSEKGAKATASHTASIAGSQQLYQGVFDKFNVFSVDSLQELVNASIVLNILKQHQFPQPGKVASINLSGAENVLCADHSEACGLEHAELSQATKDKISTMLPDFAAADNPLDMTTTFFNKIPETVELIKTLSEDPQVSVITVGGEVDDRPTGMVSSLVDSMIAAKQTVADLEPLFVLSLVEASRDMDYRRRLEAVGIPILSPGITAFSMLAKIMKHVAYRPEDHDLTLIDGDGVVPGRNEKVALSEFDSKQLLQKNGIEIPWQVTVTSREALAKELAKAPFPVAVKINSPDIFHKSDAGGVRLNLRNTEDALQAYDEIMQSCAAYDPGARIDGVLVSAMAPAGLEFIVGIKNDPQLGPCVLVGMGGVFVEIFKDVAIMPTPVNEKEALEMLKLLKAYKLLTGYRGGPQYDVDALTRLIVKVSHFAVVHREKISELDINPVFVYPQGKGVAIIDALVIGYDLHGEK
jgi:acetyltransferase